MYWCQVWKKIHRPLIVLVAIGFIIVTATQTEIEFEESDAHRNNHIDSLSDDDILLKSTSQGSSENNPQKLRNDVPTIPVSPVPQLPHCRGGHDKSAYKTDERNSLHRDKANLSEEIVVSPSRGLKSVVNERHILVSTLDGQLSLLDQRGLILWSVPTGQIFSSTISSLQLNENGKWINLIPSLTGGLYKYDGISLHPMPLSAETLLRRSFKLTSDVVMTGGKELRTFGIDLLSGTMRYECGMEGCSTQKKAESPHDEDIVLVVKKQMQTVRAIDSATGSERWNFSVATHELALAGVTEGCYEGEQKDSGHDHLLKVVIPEGLIIGADKSNHAVWQHKFSSPISQAWVLEDGMLKVIDPIKNSPRIEESPALYIGMHKQQFYVQESHTTAERLENAFELQFSHRDRDRKRIEIGWKPSSAIKGMSESKAVAPYHPEFTGFYVLEKEEMKGSLPAIESAKERLGDKDSGIEEDSENKDDFDFTEGAVQIIFVSLWFWWKEVLGISLLTAVVLNLVLMRPLIRAVRTQTVREMWGFFRNRNKQIEERAILPRKESDPLELPFTDRTRRRTTSSSSNVSQLGGGEDPTNFRSQYLDEFKPIQCLGRGGFGVVFEAKKIIDERNYAVKRIPLPNREKSRVKVMREVKALANLDHRNIVRYFNAWIEKPPLGWLEQHDPLWLESKTDASSANFMSSFEMHSRNDTDTVDLRERGPKKDYSLISIPSKTPVDEQRDPDDSFIVFASDGEESTEADNDYDCVSKCASKLVRTSDVCNSNLYASELASVISLPSNSRFGDSVVSSFSGGRGFFARPTSLDIPSMKEESGSQKDSNEVDEGIEEGIDVANNADYTPSIWYLYIQQELCQKRTLQEWLRMTKERSLLQVVSFFTQTVEAVEYIHLRKLIHRDLKPGNIFLASGVESEFGSSSKERITVKIGDFGLATTASNRFDGDILTPGGDSPSTKVNLTGHVGTHLYMSPEQSQNKPYDFKVDIYSLGLIFFELLVPFSTEMERYESLSRLRKMSFPPAFVMEHPIEHEFISKMVSHDPEQRPNATVIKKWLKSHQLSVSPSDSCSPSVSRGSTHPKSLSVDSSVLPFKKGRVLSEEDRILNKTQSCM